jgi:tetratricopeptide (TPR) repeat protein
MSFVPLILLLAALFATPAAAQFMDYHQDVFRQLLTQLANEPTEEIARERINREGNLLLCTGDSPAAKANNMAADLIARGEYERAIAELERALLYAPLFVPFRNNLGVAYYFTRDYRRAHLNFDKALLQVPEYYLFYVQKGTVCELTFDDDNALEWYKRAARLNPLNMEPLVLIGNLYFERNQRRMASQYFTHVLSKDATNADALLGTAKIHFADNKFYLCYMTLKKISITSGPYDKSYHYYYAEAAYKLRRYKEAHVNYTELLKYRYDKFFLNTSYRLIEHKAELSKRFADTEEEVQPGVE